MGKSAKRVKPNNTAKNASANSLPAFDESALTALTEKIEKGFGGKGKVEDSNAAPKPSPKQNKKVGKQDKSQASRSNTIAVGKKRNLAGDVKTPAAGEKGASSRETLLQEVLAMGGTEEDMDLVDVESDDEVEGEGSLDPKLAKELSQFIKGLGIEGRAGAEIMEEEEDVEEELESDDESEDESETADEPTPQLVPVAQRKPEKNDPNRLVSVPELD